ncbi:MAG: hypothetical protein MJ252_03875, partial [archaeon]|nr:hypothetical protein [archaeon]
LLLLQYYSLLFLFEQFLVFDFYYLLQTLIILFNIINKIFNSKFNSKYPLKNILYFKNIIVN